MTAECGRKRCLGDHDWTYCAYCGEGFELTAEDAKQRVTEHIHACAKHPMRAAEAEREQLRAMLVASTTDLQTCRDRLELLERFIRRGAVAKMSPNVRYLEWFVEFVMRRLKLGHKTDCPVEAIIRYEENREWKSKKREQALAGRKEDNQQP